MEFNDTVDFIEELQKENKNYRYVRLQVPKGIRFISQWSDFKLPEEPHIMDKEIPGCGFTEWCLTNNQDLILCSPRRVLLQNKSDQHSEVFLVKTSLDKDKNIDKDLSRKKLSDSEKKKLEETKNFLDTLNKKSPEYKSSYEKVSKELKDYIDSRKFQGQPVKILVTYDSFGIVKEILKYFGILEDFQIVIDEFQSIFTDSRFKSDTELILLEQLKDLQKVCYLSATPMMRDYLMMMKEFRNMPYYELDWKTLDPGRVIRPTLKVRVVKSIVSKAKEIIGKYLLAQYEKVYLSDGSVRESREAVFFINSVNNICSIIKNTGLTPEQCCIICSNTPENVKKIHMSIGKKFNIEGVPLKDKPRKMFTFCTRTVYLGADFYSNNARTFILSDSNIDALSVDISLDLPQIMGRQRLDENPWRNEAEFYYKSLTEGSRSKLDGKEFNDRISEKIISTKKLLQAYDGAKSKGEDVALELAKKYKKDAKLSNYNSDYVAVNRNESGNLDPVFNRLVLLAEYRAFEIQRVDYENRFSVFRSINLSVSPENDISESEKEISEFYNGYDTIKDNIEKVLKFYFDPKFSDDTRHAVYDSLPSKIKSYISLGESKIRSVKFSPSYMDKLLEMRRNRNNDPDPMENILDEQLDKRIYAEYHVGDRVLKSQLKKKLKELFLDLRPNDHVKATDINEWFETKICKVIDSSTGKRINGFELVSKKKL